MKRRTIWFIVEIVIAILLVLFLLSSTQAQEHGYYATITERQYNKIVMGEMFYDGQVQLNDGTWHKGWIARFPDSNKLRFRPEEDSIKIYTLTDKYVKSFTYNIEDTIPFFTFKEIPITRNKSEKKAIEILISGELTLYIYKTVQKIDYLNGLLQRKTEYQMLIDFYVEKNGDLYEMELFERDLAYLIKDKEEVFDFYKKTRKLRKDKGYQPYISTIVHYNETK